jgi:two-component system, cell cycle response regulator
VTAGGRVLVVDDERMNRMLARRPIEAQGHTVTEAANGRLALEHLRSEPVDVVLLDLVMPELDGYATLAEIKADPALRHIPVIVVSGVDQIASVVRCIEMGATDYLTKPFEVAILRARLDASLASKRLRDLELEYLEQVSRVTSAASALEAGAFEPSQLAEVARRDDALGLLARRFGTMADEVRAREERLRREVRELRIEIDHARQAQRVAEITDTDFFRDLRSRAVDLRRTIRHDAAIGEADGESGTPDRQDGDAAGPGPSGG